MQCVVSNAGKRRSAALRMELNKTDVSRSSREDRVELTAHRTRNRCHSVLWLFYVVFYNFLRPIGRFDMAITVRGLPCAPPQGDQ